MALQLVLRVRARLVQQQLQQQQQVQLLLLLCCCSAEAAVRRVLPCPGLAPASFGFTFGSAKKLKEQHKTFAR